MYSTYYILLCSGSSRSFSCSYFFAKTLGGCIIGRVNICSRLRGCSGGFASLFDNSSCSRNNYITVQQVHLQTIALYPIPLRRRLADCGMALDPYSDALRLRRSQSQRDKSRQECFIIYYGSLSLNKQSNTRRVLSRVELSYLIARRLPSQQQTKATDLIALRGRWWHCRHQPPELGSKAHAMDG